MKKLITALVLIGPMFLANFEARAQSMADRLAYGFGLGVQQLLSDLEMSSTKLGFGGEGVLRYRLSDQLGINLSAGYGNLPFTVHDKDQPDESGPASSNAILANLYLDGELMKEGEFRPYLFAGLGGMSYQVADSSRSTAGMLMVGAGFRFQIAPGIDLNTSAAYHHTAIDDLDGTSRTSNASNDAFFGAKIGLQFRRLQSRVESEEEPDFLAELGSEEEGGAESEESFNLESRLSELESDSEAESDSKLAGTPEKSQSGGDMQEYVRLRSQVDGMNEEIDQKEKEITSLLSSVSEKKESATKMETSVRAEPASSTNSSFSRNYEAALHSFYLKRYQDAIQKLTGLVGEFPSHSLSSSCHYWIGEANFASGNVPAAIEAFNRVLQYDRSTKKDDALLMLGKSYMQLRRREDARQAFSRLVHEHPSSEFVSQAEELLNKM